MSRARVRLPVASAASGVPASTLRRWISEHRLRSTLRDGVRWVYLHDVTHVRDTLRLAATLRNLTR